MTTSISLSPRIRKSPFFDATMRAGVQAFSVYNKTYLPIGYTSPEEEFWKLVNDVTLWDVTCQRVTEISGPDGFKFMDMLTPRDMTKCRVGQCKYVILTDQYGGILNDPVLMRLDENTFWLSAADGDILMWCKALAVNSGLDVIVREPEVATLQLQGPKSFPLALELFGPQVEDIKYYEFIETEIAGSPVILARTGWSAERGYEIYVRDLSRGEAVWDTVMEVGKAHGIVPAVPSRIRRIEAGILDYSVDMDTNTNPFEVGLDRMVALDTGRDFIGKAALEKVKKDGIKRKLVGVQIEGEKLPYNENDWPVFDDGTRIGEVTSVVYTPRMKINIGYAMVPIAYSELGTTFTVETKSGPLQATVVERPFVDPNKSLSKA
ncbi:MAG: glycine cleavage system protein T [Rhodospirillales bacterium]|jgi:glycine cleavage system aminomethyltransferase T|nr:glycine cleavage system protein T [Rhodospirillales bacterium]